MKKLLLTVCLTLTPLFANAGTITCGGTVDELSYHIPGAFILKLSSMNTGVTFCSTEGEFTPPGENRAISVDTCKQLYSTFLAARVSGQPLKTVYFDGTDVPESCNTWGAWKHASIRHYKF